MYVRMCVCGGGNVWVCACVYGGDMGVCVECVCVHVRGRERKCMCACVGGVEMCGCVHVFMVGTWVCV